MRAVCRSEARSSDQARRGLARQPRQAMGPVLLPRKVPYTGPVARTADALSESELLVSDAIGRLIEFWGFKRNMGRIWAVLYLSEAPLSAPDLRKRLRLSAGSVSMTLTELMRWGVVKKIWLQGERRDHYVAEGNLWKMISRVFQERERVEILEAIEAMERATALLDARMRTATPEEKRRAKEQKQRIGRLLDLAKIGRRLVEALVERAQVDASPIVRFLLGER